MTIERDFHKFLVELVSTRLMNNKTAKNIALNYKQLNLSSKDKFLESLIPFYNTFNETAFDKIKFEKSVPKEGSVLSKDYRLKSIRLSNVRGIPEAKGNIKYGITTSYKMPYYSARMGPESRRYLEH
jgi:hypothetical protein